MVLRTDGSFSTNVTKDAPLEYASTPTAPVPANISRKHALSTLSASDEKTAARTLSDVGLTAEDFGEINVLPFSKPLFTFTVMLP